LMISGAPARVSSSTTLSGPISVRSCKEMRAEPTSSVSVTGILRIIALRSRGALAGARGAAWASVSSPSSLSSAMSSSVWSMVSLRVFKRGRARLALVFGHRGAHEGRTIDKHIGQPQADGDDVAFMQVHQLAQRQRPLDQARH